MNGLSTIIVVNRVPLSYMVRGKDIPDANEDFLNFIYKMIACGPLKGDLYESGCYTVHQELV